MPKLPLAATAVASILVTLATGSVAQTLSPNLPLAIICFNDKTQTWRIGYLDAVSPDGSATYVAVCQTAFDSAMASPVAVRGAPPA